MSPRRRILLIAIISWSVIAMRAKTFNPFSTAISASKLLSQMFEGTAKIALPIAKLPLRIIYNTLKFMLFRHK